MIMTLRGAALAEPAVPSRSAKLMTTVRRTSGRWTTRHGGSPVTLPEGWLGVVRNGGRNGRRQQQTQHGRGQAAFHGGTLS